MKYAISVPSAGQGAGAIRRIGSHAAPRALLTSAFPALRARASGTDTVLTGPLCDRAALYGVLAEIEALGLELLEVRRLPPV